MDFRAKFRRILERPKTPPSLDTGRSEASAGPLFDVLASDLVLQLFTMLAALDPEVEGSAWHEQRRRTTRTVLALAGTCVRLRDVLGCVGHKLHAELLARSITDVQPLTNASSDYPYTDQLQAEKHSSQQFKALRYTDDQMAFHCAGKCCSEARREANRKLVATRVVPRQHKVVTPVCESARNMAAAPDALVCFVHAHKPKTRHARGRHVLRRYHGDALTHELELDAGAGYGEPLHMASNYDGALLAYTAAFAPPPDGEEGEERTSLRLYVWAPLLDGAAPVHVQADEFPNPTCIWWRHNSDQANELGVAWSTTMVNPQGQDQYDGGDCRSDEGYTIATYQAHTKDGSYEFCDVSGPFPGRLLTVDYARDDPNCRCVALVRQPLVMRSDTIYCARVHADATASQLRHALVWKAKGKTSQRDGYDWGPSAVGISPAGDCVVCIHRTSGAVLSEVFDLHSDSQYTRVNSHALTEWLGMGQGTTITGDNAVKLRYKVAFSACGRFATVIDQRARWKYNFTGYAAVVMDLAKRRAKQPVHCQPLGYCEADGEDVPAASTPMRAMAWYDNAIWVMSHRGLLLVRV